MTTINFFMPMKPPTATAQEKRIGIRDGRPYTYEPPAVKAARALLLDSLAGYSPPDPMSGPLELLVKWCFQKDPPKRWNGDPWEWHEWKTSPPDTDNLDKLLKDCMTKAGFWLDDAQVCREIIEKHWAAVPGIYIRVTELDR